MSIKVGDIVFILAGKDRFVIGEDKKKKNKTGRVIKVFFKEQKVLVEGVNIVTKHKNASNNEEKGSILKEEAPIHISNVALIDPEKNIPTRVGIRYEANKKKIRYAKKSGVCFDETIN
ncbi:50S ribosomal protein L24 [Candidatus Phytoplasma phoenicium]|uniref:Large ribosomal subunit protein uL24 n=1 Tax=Candidatus Phytoplasma phoenicium TaxID=198422 RepID=A0A0L0MKG1_9MOLU|nr:50S ribosomal protein L24 [Candidatus Phytoplasma phoenicium]KND62781.1 50S ribosomal protein L24 [Candidatus Phytoplasma phoenicium]